jgi:hypothetical protein
MESLDNLVKTQILMQEVWGWSLRIFVSKKIPGDMLMLEDSGPYLEQQKCS